MLLRQNGCRGEHRHLLAGGHGLEDRPDRHLGFAEADITAHEAVHRLRLLHVPFDIGNRLDLIRCGFVREGILEFVLPGAIHGEGEAGCLVPFGVELDQVEGDLAHGLAGAFFGLVPGGAPHAVEVRRAIAGGAVAAEAAQLVGGDPQEAIGVLDDEVIAGFAANRKLLELQELADAVVAVHHEIPRAHLVGIDRAARGLAPATHVTARGQGVLTKEFPVSDQRELPGRQLQALEFGGALRLERDGGVLFDQPIDGRVIGRVGDKAADAVVLLEQGHSAAGLGGEQPDPGLLLLEAFDQLGELAELVGVGRHGPAGEIEVVGVVVAFLQLGQVKALEALGRRQGVFGAAVQDGRQLEAEFSADLGVVLDGVIKPLLAVGEAMAPLIDGNQGAFGQVVEQRSRLIPGQAHESPHPLRCAPFQQLLAGFGAEELVKALRHALAEGIRDQGPVAARGETHHVDRIEGALAGGVEFPQLLQLLTEEFQTDGKFGADREDVDDVAATAPAALLLDARDPLVTQARQGFAERFEVKFIPLAQAEALGLQGRRRRQVRLQGAFGGDDRAAAAGIQKFAEDLELSPGDLTGGIKGLVGAALARGIELGAVPAHQFQQRCPAAGLLQGGHHDQQRGFGAARQDTADQGAGSASCPGEPQPLVPGAPLQHLSTEGHLLQLAHQGGEGHGAQSTAAHLGKRMVSS